MVDKLVLRKIMNDSNATVNKAKRRVKRYLQTGKRQHRLTVRQDGQENHFTYRISGEHFISLRSDVLRRVYLIK